MCQPEITHSYKDPRILARQVRQEKDFRRQSTDGIQTQPFFMALIEGRVLPASETGRTQNQ